MSNKQLKKIDGELFSVQKSAVFLDVSPNTIRRWAQDGKLQGLKIGSRGDWRFTKNDLLEMLRKG